VAAGAAAGGSGPGAERFRLRAGGACFCCSELCAGSLRPALRVPPSRPGAVGRLQPLAAERGSARAAAAPGDSAACSAGCACPLSGPGLDPGFGGAEPRASHDGKSAGSSGALQAERLRIACPGGTVCERVRWQAAERLLNTPLRPNSMFGNCQAWSSVVTARVTRSVSLASSEATVFFNFAFYSVDIHISVFVVTCAVVYVGIVLLSLNDCVIACFSFSIVVI